VVCIDASLGGQTITLTSGEIAIAKNLTIQANGSPPVISGGGTSRVFFIQSPAVVNISGVVIRDGLASGSLDGGGVYVYGAATVNMTDCAVTACRSGGNGGGISNNGTLTLTRCTVSGNVAFEGGGIDNVAGGHLTMTNCTVSGNAAAGYGGGIANHTSGSTVVATSCTIVENISGGFGGGIYAAGGDASAVTLGSSILANNTAYTGLDCDGVLGSADYNLVGAADACSFTGTTTHNLQGLDPRLGSLQANGGLTKTHPLLPGSPAIDTIPSVSCGSPADQRGVPRPQDGNADTIAACDIGAYEAVRPIVVTSLADTGDAGTCTLRQAVDAANSNSSATGCFPGSSSVPDRIVFGVTGTITLASPLLAFESVMIDGPGADVLTVSGGGTSQVFEFRPGFAANQYTLAGVTVANGYISGGAGGGVFFYGSNNVLSIDRTYFKDNVSTATGGALAASLGGFVDIARSTFTGAATSNFMYVEIHATDALVRNSTFGETHSSLLALAEYTEFPGTHGTLTVENCTLKGTEPEGVGAYVGASATPGSAVVRLKSTVLAGHGTNVSNRNGTIVSLGYNISTDASGGLSGPGDLTSTDPKLGVLAYNGGPVPTVDTLPGSPAIGHVSAAALPPTVDQRGFARWFALADSGAIQRVTGGDVNGDGAIDVADLFILINFLFAGGPPPVGEADMSGDGSIDVVDVFYLINYLFAGGPAPV
jgi:CSLREA domain-containing protein